VTVITEAKTRHSAALIDTLDAFMENTLSLSDLGFIMSQRQHYSNR
jgi:hypothetical protein